jgi:hypothetical protein
MALRKMPCRKELLWEIRLRSGILPYSKGACANVHVMVDTFSDGEKGEGGCERGTGKVGGKQEVEGAAWQLSQNQISSMAAPCPCPSLLVSKIELRRAAGRIKNDGRLKFGCFRLIWDTPCKSLGTFRGLIELKVLNTQARGQG